ncbi:fumarate hydratase [Mesorhizobium sp. WSM3866]|uniref:fumarate hydratase n=1 Tax=Mesorhizobium sp. WSM3866 TaxID=422271 RepID=UPI000BAE7788|nr:fumarate hydratase [Mesorhizobium sp. WSM3866]PBB41213.1 fumarate hydratase [Mesorhizobium sp. WSM3866]
MRNRRAHTVISGKDITESVADALQYISYYHPPDYIRYLSQAYRREKSAPARNAIGQILLNSRMAAFGRRPICQDTGLVVVFAKVGMSVRIAADVSFVKLINEGVRRAYLDPDNPLRPSVVADPLEGRTNTRDNTPAIVHVELVAGNTIEFTVAAKGGGSENKARFTTLNPGDSVADWVVETVAGLGSGWCPPGMISVGIGGSSEKAMLLAKEAMNEPIDIAELAARGASSLEEALRLELYERINALGIGAQGLGGLTTVVDVKVATYPTHAASKPVALIPQCAANRHIGFALDGSGAARFEPPDLSQWPEVGPEELRPKGVRRVNLDALTKDEVTQWRCGQTLLLSGKLLTGRDVAHKRLCELIEAGRPLPVNFAGRMIYYVGPVRAVGDEVVGPAGPTTSSRMDAFTDSVLAATGLAAMIGKAERGPAAIESIIKHQTPYMVAVGGAAYLISKSIKSARLIAFEDLGMEAIHEFEVQDMPVIVAVDAFGSSIHSSGPAEWRKRMAADSIARSIGV